MAETKTRARRRPAIVGAFAARPRLLIAMAVGLAAGVGLGFRLDTVDAIALGWDAFCLTFAGLMLPRMARRTPAQMRKRAEEDDEGRAVILCLVIAAAGMSMFGAAGEIHAAKTADKLLEQALHAVLAFTTVAASWFFVQLNFALHYAHRYYSRDPKDGTGDEGGLSFPGRGAPDYWDFLHFSVIIGVASQTADIAITSKVLRRLNTVHAAFAFTFNTIVVALTINLLASLFE